MRHATLRRLWAGVGFRGSTLLFFALIDLALGLSLLAPPPPTRLSETQRFVDATLPLPVWGLAWLAVAVTCAVYAFRRRDRVAFAAAIVIKVVWGLVALGGQIFGYLDRGWVGAFIWLGMAGWVLVVSYWPEPPHPLRTDGGA